MSMCEAVSDRMPAVASGQSEWTSEERAHLASCSDCAAEWRLVKAALTLGRHVTVDAVALTPLMLERWRAADVEERRSRWVKRAALVGSMAIAALLLLVMVPRWSQVSPVLPPSGVGVVATPVELKLAELDDAEPAELELVLVEFEEPAVPASSLDGPDLEGLDVSQLEQALRSWEES